MIVMAVILQIVMLEVNGGDDGGVVDCDGSDIKDCDVRGGRSGWWWMVVTM